jgi:hypothetical protein
MGLYKGPQQLSGDGQADAAESGWRIYYTAPDMTRLRLPALYAVGATVALLVVLAVGERLVYRDRVLPGVRLAGVQVAGRSTAAARASVAAAAARLEREPLVATAGSARLTLRPQAVGLAVDAAAMTRAVLRAGRSGNPLTQLVGPLRRRLRPIQLSWAVGYSRPTAAKALIRWADVVHRPPVEGHLRIQGATVIPVRPRPGQRLDRSGAVDSVAAAFASPGGLGSPCRSNRSDPRSTTPRSTGPPARPAEPWPAR